MTGGSKTRRAGRNQGAPARHDDQSMNLLCMSAGAKLGHRAPLERRFAAEQK